MDPRLNGFNYGAPIGAPTTFLPYRRIVAGANVLLHARGAFAPDVWSLDMAIRDVRHACSREELAGAMVRLWKHRLAGAAHAIGRSVVPRPEPEK